MLNFKTVTQKDAPRLARYYCDCNYRLCEYSVGTKLMWRDELHPSWTEEAGCLLVRNTIRGQEVYDYPVPGPDGDEEAALTAIEDDCAERGVIPVISVVPEAKAPVLLRRYPYAKVNNIRTWKDYLYYKEDLQYFAGRHYAGQRNHIRKFQTLYPDVIFRELKTGDFPLIGQFWDRYEREFAKADNPKARAELSYAKRMLRLTGKPWFRVGGFLDGGSLIALALAEKIGDTMIIHIEKALYSYNGIYPALVQTFAQTFGEDVKYFNREDDAADPGLRSSKMQYGPALLAAKFCFEPQNEVQHYLTEIPTLETARLTLSALTEADIPAYNALVLDRERNRWWGYDDIGGLNGPVRENSFFRVAERDFRNCLAVNFAVRLEGKMIGEAVLYHFNCRGEAELGCRILPEYAGFGYGTEAFAAAADWALYKLHLTRLVAKCYHENKASFRMLSSCMRKCGGDETFDYFEKLL